MSSPLDAVQGGLQRLVEARTPVVAPAGSEPSVGAPVIACQAREFKAKGYHLDAGVPAELLVSAAGLLSEQGFAIDTVTGVDWLADGQMEVVYDFYHPQTPGRVVLRVRVPRDQPEVPTISGIFPGANWHERETHDFFGIRFSGHPDLSPLLLPEDADFHPLRKDYPGAA